MRCQSVILSISTCTSAFKEREKNSNQGVKSYPDENPAPKAAGPKRPVNDHGYTHICLQVSDIASEYERLKGAGMTFNAEPVDLGGETCAYGRDPFGNVIEILERKAQ